jgi:hypothetical protein
MLRALHVLIPVFSTPCEMGYVISILLMRKPGLWKVEGSLRTTHGGKVPEPRPYCCWCKAPATHQEMEIPSARREQRLSQ